MIKLLALDLDGTLLNDRKEISEKNKEAIFKARQKGVKVVLCTGRPIMGIQEFLTELDLFGDEEYCITFNGGLVQKTKDQTILAAKTLSRLDIEKIYDWFFEANLPINMIDLEKVYEPTYPIGAASIYPEIIKNLVFEKKEISDFEPTKQFNKALSCLEQAELDERLKQVPAEFFENYSAFKSRPMLLEILPLGVDKSFGLKELANYLNITADNIMTVGDEENDLAMIKFAKYGVAMGNARADVKEAAKFVTTDCNHDGVAHAIEHFILND